jgi:hypothetical protein
MLGIRGDPPNMSSANRPMTQFVILNDVLRDAADGTSHGPPWTAVLSV